MNTAMTYVTALCADHVPVTNTYSHQLLSSAKTLLTLAPAKSSSCWCQLMFGVLLDTMQKGTLLYAHPRDACAAIVDEVRQDEWFEPEESYSYQIELKNLYDAIQRIVDCRSTGCTTHSAVQRLPYYAAVVAYRLYAMEQGFIEDIDDT